MIPRPATSSTVQRPSFSKIDQIGKKSDGSTCTSRISVRIPFSVLQAYALLTTHSERLSRLCDPPDANSSRRLSSPSRAHRPPPSHHSRRSRVLSILHANPRRWLPNGHSQPDRLLPRRIHRQRPRNLRSKRILKWSAIHFPRWTRVEPRLTRGYEWPAIWERLVVVSNGKLDPIVHGE
jgi:hypothetical protein